MNKHADKNNERESLAVANSLTNRNSKTTLQFIVQNPEAIAQRKLQDAIHNSPSVKQLKAYQTMANKFTSKNIQRKENMDKTTLHGNTKPVQNKKNNTGLPDNLKSGIESLSGYAMDDVNVNYNSSKPAQLKAHAYAQGTEIHLAPGQEKHLPHEAWHVVQQKQGRVKPTIQMKGNVNINDDTGLENEADVMGKKALEAGAGKDIFLKKQETNSIIFQRFYAASKLMKFSEVIDEPKDDQASTVASVKKEKAPSYTISLSDNFSGPWKKCTDTTSKGYRETANKDLGSNAPLNALEKHKLIMAPDSKRFAYTLSHLISAEFGGQLKYSNPKENIRFFPEQIEYGWWQKAETDVKNNGDIGRLQVTGSDSSFMLKFGIAHDLISIVADKFTHKQRFDIEKALWEILSGAEYVPKDVNFSYKDYGKGKDVEATDSGLNKGLSINKSAPIENVFRFLSELKILPEIDQFGEKLIVETASSKVIKKQELPAFILEMAPNANKRATTMIDGINRLLDGAREGKFQLKEKMEDQINKWPEVKKKTLSISIDVASDDFDHISF